MVHRWEQWSQSLTISPGGRAEIENVEKTILTFSISALPLEVIFQMSAQVLHLWTLCQKVVPQIFDRRCINRNIEQNVREGCLNFNKF